MVKRFNSWRFLPPHDYNINSRLVSSMNIDIPIFKKISAFQSQLIDLSIYLLLLLLFPSMNVDNQELTSETLHFGFRASGVGWKYLIIVFLWWWDVRLYLHSLHLPGWPGMLDSSVAERAACTHRNAAFPNWPPSDLMYALFLSFLVLRYSICILFHCILYSLIYCIFVRLFFPL